jgi:hypothetical protein
VEESYLQALKRFMLGDWSSGSIVYSFVWTETQKRLRDKEKNQSCIPAYDYSWYERSNFRIWT